MIVLKFKNLERSEIAREAVFERLIGLIQKFPDLERSRLEVTLEMENSPLKVGPDFFTVKLHIASGRFKGITLKKADANIYVALAELSEHMLERLNRFGDRARVKQRKQARRMQTQGRSA